MSLILHTHTHTQKQTSKASCQSVNFCFPLSHSDTYAQTHNLRASRHWMVSECEKGTSSSVYQALLSTHPLPQWPHWGWAQVKAYLKDLFNTEKRGHIPKTTGKGRLDRGRGIHSRLLTLHLSVVFKSQCFTLSLSLSPSLPPSPLLKMFVF